MPKFVGMMLRVYLCILALILFVLSSQNILAQALDKPLASIIFRNSLLFGINTYGFQTGLGKQVVQLQKKKIYRNGNEKLITKHRSIFFSAGFYNQAYLHLNIFSTMEFSMVRVNRKGWYREFMPAIGLSRTFFHETVYKVTDNGAVELKRFAGDWRLAGGFSFGFGKNLALKKAPDLHDVYLKLNTQMFYPNFRFIAFKPSLVFGLNVNLSRHKHSYRVISKTVYQWKKQKN